MTDQAFFARPAVAVAPELLGAVLTHRTAEGEVAVRLTEVEAYAGVGEDPGSHAHRGRTPRTSVMFGPPGRLYAYFTYGMHTCANVVTSPEGVASAVLLRAGEVVSGLDLARSRRPNASDRDLARGPARLVNALGIALAENGADLSVDPFALSVPAHARGEVVTGPRVGVAGAGGDGVAFPWRFRLRDEPTVSVYRPGRPSRPASA